MNELRDIAGYEGLYAASSDGRIWAHPRRWKCGVNGQIERKSIGRWLKPNKLVKGYLIVKLCRDGVTRDILVATLVARAFVPNPSGRPQINHINGVKDDNRVENLEWVTPSENIRHAWRTGLHGPRSLTACRENSKKAIRTLHKLTVESAAEVRRQFARGGISKAELGRQFGVSATTIYSIVHNQTYRTGEVAK